MRIGLISDTHGLVRPEALAWLRHSDHIVHAGDICDAAVLDVLRGLAPLTVVRGNNDRGPWAAAIPAAKTVVLDGVSILVLHDIADLALDPAAAGVRVVVTGHSHRPAIEERAGVLFVNPGSAGPRRFRLPISAGELQVRDGTVQARTVELVGPGGG